MNIINRLTLRHLKQNKRRTLVTMIGVILSVTMLGAVSIGLNSFLDVLIRYTQDQTGLWHVRYDQISKTQLDGLRADSDTKDIIVSADQGFSLLPGSENEYKPYLFLRELSRNAFEKMPITLLEGRLPQRANEVLLPAHVESNGGVKYQLGDVIELALGQRVSTDSRELDGLDNKELYRRNEDGTIAEELRTDRALTVTVVGICERTSMEPYTAPGYMLLSLLDETKLSDYSRINAWVESARLGSQIYQRSEKLANKLGIESYDFNKQLLRYYGIVNNHSLIIMMILVLGTVLTIIIVGSVLLIYNAFAISLSERARDLGMMASVGATRKQKRRSVFFEGAVIGGISIPFGIFFAFIGMGITFACLNPVFQKMFYIKQELCVKISWASVAATVLMTALTILLSTWRPAKRAARISPIDAIRQTRDLKITASQVKTSRLTKKLFGFAGDIALKNQKRNKKRYRTTIFSIALSVVLFIVVSSFLSYFRISQEADGINIDYDIKVSSSAQQQTLADPIWEPVSALYQKINTRKEIKESALVGLANLETTVAPGQVTPYLEGEEGARIRQPDGSYTLGIKLVSLDDQSLQKAAKEAGTTLEALKDPEHPGVLVAANNHFTVRNGDLGYRYVRDEVLKTKKGEMLTCTDFASEQNFRFTVAGSLKTKPFGTLENSGGLFQITLIVSEAIFKALPVTCVEYGLMLTSDSPAELAKQIDLMTAEADLETSCYVYNAYERLQHQQQVRLFYEVFGYGFISLIAAICAANIFNTVSTGMALRKREFAMLRSVGMTQKQFGRMLRYECLFYGLKGLMFGLPVSLILSWLLHRAFSFGITFPFTLPWREIAIAVTALFLVIGLTMLYAGAKIKKENIVDVLRQENV